MTAAIVIPAIIFVVSLTIFVWLISNYDYGYRSIYLIGICISFGITVVSLLILKSALLRSVFLCLY